MVMRRFVLNKGWTAGLKKKFRWTYLFNVACSSVCWWDLHSLVRSNDVLCFEREDATTQHGADMRKKNGSRHNRRMNDKGKFPFLRMQKQTWYLIVFLTMCLLILLAWTGDNSHRSSRGGIYPFVVCGEDRRHLSSQQSPSVDGPSLSSLSFRVPVSVFQPTVYCGGGGGSYFSSNIKPPHRRARGPPSRGAAWTRCGDCCPFPSGRLTSDDYFLQDFMTEL